MSMIITENSQKYKQVNLMSIFMTQIPHNQMKIMGWKWAVAAYL
jgi:hypothetical protein